MFRFIHCKIKHQGFFSYITNNTFCLSISSPTFLKHNTYTPILSCTCLCQMNAKHNFSISSLTFFVPNIITVKSRTMRLTLHGTKNGKKRNTCILVGYPELKGPTGRSRCRWEANMKISWRYEAGGCTAIPFLSGCGPMIVISYSHTLYKVGDFLSTQVIFPKF